MKKNDIRYGQNIVHNDGTIVKVHHVDEQNRVHYFAILTNGNKGVPGYGVGMIVHNDDYKLVYGTIDQFRPAAPSEKTRMERWLIEKAKKS